VKSGSIRLLCREPLQNPDWFLTGHAITAEKARKAGIPGYGLHFATTSQVSRLSAGSVNGLDTDGEATMTALTQPRGILALTLLALLIAGPASAQAPPQPIAFTFDEHGHGSETLPDGTVVPLVSSTVLFDPVVGVQTLSYLVDPGQEGFVLLSLPGEVSDVLHFSSFLGGSVFFYSDPTEPGTASDLADTVGFARAFAFAGGGAIIQEEVGSEGANGALYVPGATDPGFFPGFSVSYNIISDGVAVPEPSALVLLATGVGLAGIAWRRQRR
jgi:hypothetical protein